MSFLDPFLNATFGFLLNWPPLLAVCLVSFAISLLITIIYKFTTNQTEMKRLKEELSGHQKKMKEIKDNPEKMMEVQKEAMKVNMQYMSHSMRSTLITFIPILLIFGWMNAHFAYEPLLPGEQFSLHVNFQKEIAGNANITVPDGIEVVGNTTQDIANTAADFQLKGKEGDYFVTLSSNGQDVDKRVIITTGRNYAPVLETYKNTIFRSAQLGNKPFKVFWKLSWIWAYIIFAIIFSTILRKLLKIY